MSGGCDAARPALQLTLELAFEPGRGFADFRRAASNSRALDLARGWRRWPSVAAIVDGPPGAGKTHLAYAWRDAVGGALASGPALGEPSRLLGELERGAAFLAVDDADQTASAEALFHLYQHLAGRGGRLLLTATRPLAAWPLALDDLRSRLRTAATAAIERPDDALFEALLRKLLDDRRLPAAPDVLAYATARLERSHGAARAFVRLLDQLSLQARRPITVPLARAALAELAAWEQEIGY